MGLAFSTGFHPDSLPDLTGKVMLVTGGNAGVGFAAIQHLARRGAKVYMAARSEDRANAALARLRAAGLGPGHGEVVWLYLDLSDPRIAKKAAQTVLERETRLDVLVNCAALLLIPFATTHDGIQDIVMVNYLSPVVFTRALLPLLKQTASEPDSDVRIINLVSQEHKHVENGTRFRHVDDFNIDYKNAMLPQFYRYARTKLMGILHAKALQRQLDAEGVPIIVMAVNPGLVNTEGVQAYSHSVGLLSPLSTLIANVFFARPARGAYSTVFAAAAPAVRAEPARYRGAYVVPPGKRARPSGQAEDAALAAELWDTTERVLESIGI